MPSAFETAWVSRRGALDRRWGEAFELRPVEVPAPGGRPDRNARPTLAPGRAAVPFTGRFHTDGESAHAHGRAMADATTRPITAETPMVSLQLDDIGAAPGDHDVIVRLGTGERFAVTTIERKPIRRALVYLRRLS